MKKVATCTPLWKKAGPVILAWLFFEITEQEQAGDSAHGKRT
jgi:hypothetical protein